MQIAANDFCRYARVLQADGLALSVHFRSELVGCLPAESFVPLYPFNCHPDPYCTRIKSVCRPDCLQANRTAITRCAQYGSQLCACHADVLEYHQGFARFDEPIGVITVSIGRAPQPVRRKSAEEQVLFDRLPAAAIDFDELDARITPLCRMLTAWFEQQPMRAPADHALAEFHRIQIYLNENHADVSLDMLCDAFHCSTSHLSHLFQKNAGCSLHAYCNRLRVHDAEKLLRGTDLSVTEIAQTVGFSDASYFVRVFRAHTGCTPRAYRKSGMNPAAHA